MNDFSQLAKLCEGKYVYIQTHNFPDPDAIASAFGLQRLLELFDISSALCYDGRLDKVSARPECWRRSRFKCTLMSS